MPSMIVFLILLCVVLALVCFAEADIEKPRRSIEIEGSLPHVPDASSCPHRETVSDFHNMLTLPKRFAAHKISFRYGEAGFNMMSTGLTLKHAIACGFSSILLAYMSCSNSTIHINNNPMYLD